MYRIHRRSTDPWWFSRDGSGRFDLDDVGTCYFAEDPLGSFIDVFRQTSLLHERELTARVLTTIAFRRPLILADCTSGRARRFGVTAAIHSSENFERTQPWAGAFARAGFDGIRYLVSHDPRARLVGVALFGRARGRWPKGRAVPIPRDVVERARVAFGITVLPSR